MSSAFDKNHLDKWKVYINRINMVQDGKEINLLCKILENILDNPKDQQYHVLDPVTIAQKFKHSAICINLLYESGFCQSNNGKTLSYDVNKLGQLQLILVDLLEIKVQYLRSLKELVDCGINLKDAKKGIGMSTECDHIIFEGWLQKESLYFKTLRKRWTVLRDDNKLYFYTEKQIYSKPTETIHLTCKNVKILYKNIQRSNQFALIFDKQQRIFVAESTHNMNKWIAHIKCTINSQLKENEQYLNEHNSLNHLINYVHIYNMDKRKSSIITLLNRVEINYKSFIISDIDQELMIWIRFEQQICIDSIKIFAF
eukprot:277996_1